MIFLVMGFVLLAVASVDFLLTTIGTGTSGPLSRRVAAATFAMIRRLPFHYLAHRTAGVFVMTVLGVTWIALFGIAWFLIFRSHPEAVVMAQTEKTAGSALVFSHIGHLLSTVGGGITQPGNWVWAALSVFVGINGMVVLTLSVSFVLTTTQAVTHGRALLTLAEASNLKGRGLPEPVLSALSALTSEFRSVPLALYYSAKRPARRVPYGLFKLYTHPDIGDEGRAQMRVLLEELPGMTQADDETFAQALEKWYRRFDLEADPR